MENNNDRFWFSISDNGIWVHDGDMRIAECGRGNLGAAHAAIICQALNNELEKNPNLKIND